MAVVDTQVWTDFFAEQEDNKLEYNANSIQSGTRSGQTGSDFHPSRCRHYSYVYTKALVVMLVSNGLTEQEDIVCSVEMYRTSCMHASVLKERLLQKLKVRLLEKHR